MKTTKLLGVLISAFLVVGCGSMGGKPGSAATGTQAAAPAQTDDAAISESVKSALAADPDYAGTKLSVDTTQGKVKLKGEVKTVAAFLKAPTIVRKVPGVVDVDNQLVVCTTCK